MADREETAAHKRERGNVAKLRDALEQAKVAILAAKEKMGVENPIILEIIDEALAAPPRNCEVGTAEEQLKRFKDFCRIISKDETCDGCPLLPQCSTLEHCTLKWAQMPYEKGGAK